MSASKQADAYLENCRLVDLDSGVSSRPQTVRIANGTISDADAGRPPLGTTTFDMSGMYVLPGLVSCHAHLQGQYPYSLREEGEPPALTALRAAHRARQLLDAGITTVRSVHEHNRADLAVQSAARKGWVKAPRILGAGRALTVPGGHGDGLGCVITSGRAGFEEAAAAELAAGADHVKIFLTGGLARAGEAIDELQMDPEEIAGAVDAAVRYGSYVVAHAASSKAIQVGIAHGVRSFEHAYHLDAETARQLATAGVFLTPTLVATHATGWMSERGFDSQAIARSKAASEAHMQGIRLAVAAGVQIVNGTDFPAADLDNGCPLAIREIELLILAGMTPLESIRAATLIPADLLGLTGHIGRVAPGYAADLVATRADPVQDPAALRDIRVVISAGRVVRA